MGAVLLLSACSATAEEGAGTGMSGRGPALDVAVVAEGLDHPWDVAQARTGPCCSTSAPAG